MQTVYCISVSLTTVYFFPFDIDLNSLLHDPGPSRPEPGFRGLGASGHQIQGLPIQLMQDLEEALFEGGLSGNQGQEAQGQYRESF